LTSATVAASETYTVSTFNGACTVPVQVLGDGPPLLYLHGPFGLVEEPLVEALAERARVYIPAHPGFEGTEGADSLRDTPADLELHYDDVLEGLGFREPIDVVGHSFGGFIAGELAAVHPARVRRQAWGSPDSIAESDVTATMNASARMSNATSFSRGRSVVSVGSRRRLPRAMPAPTIPPRTASRADSSRNSRSSRADEAPSARRTQSGR